MNALRGLKPVLKALSLVALLLASPMALRAQGRQAVVKLMSFSGEGFLVSELNGLQNLVAAQIVQLRGFRLTDDSGRDLALSETEQALALGANALPSTPLSADYVLTGTLSRVGELVIFSLANTRVRDGEKLVVTDSASSINDIAARSGALTRSLFGGIQLSEPDPAFAASPNESPAGPGMGLDAAEPSTAGTTDSDPGSSPALDALASDEPRALARPSMAMLAATWRGDKGLETIRIYPNGTGMAFLSGGGTMRIRIRIQNSTIEIWQNQPNDPAMYRSPNWGFETAQAIAKEARPMRWLFSLSDDEQILFGRKESVAYDGLARTVDNDYERDARWERLSR